jgi:hypothetical protein
MNDIYYNNILGEPIISFENNEPCEHKGCIAHISHSCEVCGRINAKGKKTINRFLYDKLLKENKMKKIEKLKYVDNSYLFPKIIVRDSMGNDVDISLLFQEMNNIIDNVNNQCNDCGFIASLKRVWDTPDDKPFKVKIIKCSMDTYWYKNEIGKEFEIENNVDCEDTVYFIKNKNTDDEQYYYIDKQDCEIVEEPCGDWIPSKIANSFVEEKAYYCSDCLTKNCKHALKNSELLKGCAEKTYKPNWQKAVDKIDIKFDSFLKEVQYESFEKLIEIKIKYNQIISLMQTEIENLMWQVNTEANEVSKLKQQLTENSAHSAGVINNLEAENKQLKSSQIKIDKDFITILEYEIQQTKKCHFQTVNYNFSLEQAERLLKQIRDER